MYKFLLLHFIFNLLIKLSYQTTYQGIATTYGGIINGGSCGFKTIWTNKNIDFNYGVAINSKQYNNSLSCGKCINIQYNNKNINTIVTDICPECEYGDLDLFTSTYSDLISETPGKKNINWNFIDCPKDIVADSIQLRIDEINYYWLSIIPENFKCQISSIFIFQDSRWIELLRDDNIMKGLYFIYNKKINTPFKIKIYNIYNEEIISDNIFEITNLINLNNQFQCSDLNNLNSSNTNNVKEIIVTQHLNNIEFETLNCD